MPTNVTYFGYIKHFDVNQFPFHFFRVASEINITIGL